MKKYSFASEKELCKFLEEYCYAQCKCGGVVEVEYMDVSITVKEPGLKRMIVRQIPMLKCIKCESVYPTYYVQRSLRFLYSQLKKRKEDTVECKNKGTQKQFNYCLGKNVIYDTRDYESIPGLCFDDEHSIEGFLQPVYFDKKALVYFANVTDYELDWGAESYGEIRKKDGSSRYSYEWAVPFGFNSNGKMVCWLGDIDTMDDVSLTVLLAHNIPSDHYLTDSDFYRGQMQALFSPIIKERQVLVNNNAFIKNIRKNYGIEIGHLTKESTEIGKKVRRPVSYTSSELSEVVNAYREVLIDGLDKKSLKELYEAIVPEGDRATNYNSFGQIKLLDHIVRFWCMQASQIDAKGLIAPLYLLNDWRLVLDHLYAEDDAELLKKNITDTLGVNDFNNQKEVFDKMINRLAVLYQNINVMSM